jgi:hypothetical protein
LLPDPLKVRPALRPSAAFAWFAGQTPCGGAWGQPRWKSIPVSLPRPHPRRVGRVSAPEQRRAGPGRRQFGGAAWGLRPRGLPYRSRVWSFYSYAFAAYCLTHFSL